MGLRGPRGMDPEARAARGGRDRSTPFQSDAAKRAWAKRAATFERQGQALINKAMARPVVQTRNNGSQVAPEFRMGMQLLRAADQLWARLGRVGPPDGRPAKPDPKKPKPLAAYARD